MANELDSIVVRVDCPKCGRELSVSYRTMRLQKSVGCSCGAAIRLANETSIADIQRLIDQQNPPVADND
ncbi:hypothetical protein E5554_08285 [Sphingobium sp. PAMC28499]|nr:hypothetical protein E5554_08285 [Sphingobium sp. PAMC28499]